MSAMEIIKALPILDAYAEKAIAVVKSAETETQREVAKKYLMHMLRTFLKEHGHELEFYLAQRIDIVLGTHLTMNVRCMKSVSIELDYFYNKGY